MSQVCFVRVVHRVRESRRARREERRELRDAPTVPLAPPADPNNTVTCLFWGRRRFRGVADMRRHAANIRRHASIVGLRSLRSATMDDARAALEAAGERQANIDTYAVRVAGLIPPWVRHYNPRIARMSRHGRNDVQQCGIVGGDAARPDESF